MAAVIEASHGAVEAPAHPSHLHKLDPQADSGADRAVLIAILLAMAVLSIGVHWWRRSHNKSYQLASLAALWLFPAVAGVSGHWWRFLTMWALFSAAAGLLLRKIFTERPLHRDTPGLMYKIFSNVHSFCALAAGTSYAAFMVIMITFPPDRRVGAVPELLFDVLFSILTQSVYFGVLVRDIAEIAAENVSSALGYYKKDDDDDNGAEVPAGMCALCGQYLPGFEAAGLGATASRVAAGEAGAAAAGGRSFELAATDFEGGGEEEDDADEAALHPFGHHSPTNSGGVAGGVLSFLAASPVAGRGFVAPLLRLARLQPPQPAVRAVRTAAGDEVFSLPCKHNFHALCIKGWTLIGKRNSCPCCCAKVELSSVAGRTLLGRQTLFWAQLLGLARYLVVWLPLMLALSRFFLYEAGVEVPAPHAVPQHPPPPPAGHLDAALLLQAESALPTLSGSSTPPLR